MKKADNFYSLIKISPNALAGDSVTIGIVLNNNGHLECKFSRSRKNAVKSMFDDIKAYNIDFYEKQICEKIEQVNELRHIENNSLFQTNNHFDESYFRYLSKYTNGTLLFTNPTNIEGEKINVNIQKLFDLLVTEDRHPEKDEQSVKVIQFFDRISKKLILPLKNKVHIQHKFGGNDFPSLLNPFTMDCIGKNGVLVGAKSVPPSSMQTMAAYTNAFSNVIFHLSMQYNLSPKENKFFLIADEPNSSQSDKMKWKQLRNENIFKLIPSSEAGVVVDEIMNRNATTFIDIHD